MNMLPQDPIVLYSYVNTMLRDKYPSLAELCKTMGVDESDIISRLQIAGFEYDEQGNQFR